MFHRYCITFTFPPLKKITKDLFIMERIVIPCSFKFKSPALHKYGSASSLSESFKFLVLQFLVKCCKLHSVFKILLNSHMLDIFYFQVCTTNFQINYDFSKSIKIIFIHILYTSIELTCGTLIIKIKNSISACSIVSRVFIHASTEPLCGILIINLGKNSICACY